MRYMLQEMCRCLYIMIHSRVNRTASDMFQVAIRYNSTAWQVITYSEQVKIQQNPGTTVACKAAVLPAVQKNLL